MPGPDSVSVRLRQAILLNDLPLVERLLENNIRFLYNPDFNDKSNTSLHLTAQHGLVEMAEYLISLGHDNVAEVTDYIYSNSGTDQGISVNTDGQCPLHLAVANAQIPMVRLLCERFPQTVNRSDKAGRTPLLLASGGSNKIVTGATNGNRKLQPNVPLSDDIQAIEILLDHGADVHTQDHEGNTCLHSACAWGNLKAVRALVQAGADPLCSNYAGWTPESYSLTVQADVYFRNLVAEYEKRKAEENMRMRERRAQGGGGVRMVAADDDEEESESNDDETGRSRADSGRSDGASSVDSGFVVNPPRTDSWR